MQFRDFQQQLSLYPVFSIQDIRKVMPSFSYRQLSRWEEKGYLRNIRQGYYSFTDQKLDQLFLFRAANKIYTPSYISLEMALKWYGMIPEEVFQITSVSTKKTAGFATPIGNFKYQHLKPSLFFGYHLMDQSPSILIAGLEKALLDYLYLNPRLKTMDDFRNMRINGEGLKSKIDLKKFKTCLDGFGSKALNRRAHLLLKTFEL
jgi:predicted transcriptional regulator of viral defense system